MKNTMMESFIDFLEKGVSPYHVTKEVSDQLDEAGFTQLSLEEPWELKAQEAYSVNIYDAAKIAFILPKNISSQSRFRIVAAHTDFPGPRIKPSPEMSKEGYLQLNTEIYGGAIYASWFDRPLSIAGKVALKSNHLLAPKMRLFDFKRPVLSIPQLAIHMNRKINDGVSLNPQKDLLPIVGMKKTANAHFFMDVIAAEMKVKPEDILDFDLRVYNSEAPALIGLDADLLSSPRLDNLSSVWSILNALKEYRLSDTTNQNQSEDICIGAFFDHEEIGSRSKQGAGSFLLRDVLERIAEALGFDREDTRAMLYKSFLISADVAHALHPNHTDKNDLTTKPVLNQGFCIKESGSQAYLTDPEVMAMLHQLCAADDIKIQRFINRSDERGGSTLGAIASSFLPIRGADIGIPILAMHSARELMGCEDLAHFCKLLDAFYHTKG